MKRSGKSSGKPTPEVKEPESMDPTVTEARVGAPRPNSERVCWAIKTLNEEVWSLFPETPVEYSAPDGRNTMLDVTYDLSSLDKDDAADFVSLMALYDFDADSRVREVVAEDGKVLVSMVPNARTQDKRDSFGLADAYSVLNESEGFAYGDGGDAFDDSSDSVDGGGA